MKDINELRGTIDQIDEKIIYLLKERMNIVSEIGKIKKKNSLPILDKKRKAELLEINKNFAHKTGISKNLIEKIFSLIHDEAVKLQKIKI